MFSPINGWTKKKIIKHIKENFKGQALNPSGEAYYQTKDGKKCAFGLFIPHEKYTPEMEGKNALTVSLRYNLEDDLPLPFGGMTKFQKAHDNFMPPGSIKSQRDFLINWVHGNVKD